MDGREASPSKGTVFINNTRQKTPKRSRVLTTVEAMKQEKEVRRASFCSIRRTPQLTRLPACRIHRILLAPGPVAS